MVETISNMIQGKDLILSLNGIAIAAAKSGSISTDTSFINVASPIDGAWEHVMPTTLKWSAHTDGLISDPVYIDTLLHMQISKQPISLKFSADGNDVRLGSCYISHIEQTGSVGSLAKYSIDLQGSGPLGVPVEFEDILQSASDQWIEYDGGGLNIRGQEQGRTVLAASVLLNTPKVIAVYGDGAWGISRDTVDIVDGYFHTVESSALNRGLEACGLGNGTVRLDPGRYVMLKNNFESINMMLE